MLQKNTENLIQNSKLLKEKFINVIKVEVKNIRTVDIPTIEKDLVKSEKLIETYKDNIKENERIVRDTEKENKQKLKEYEDIFNIMSVIGMFSI